MKKKIKVAILFDKKNPWIAKFISKHDFSYFKKKFSIKFFFDKKKIKNIKIVFFLGYTKIINLNLLKKINFPLVIHESNLPKGRGFAPVQWQILEGKKKIICCLILINEKIDAGKILFKDYLLLNGKELNFEIRKKQAYLTKKLIKKFLNSYPNISFKSQKGKATYYKKREKKDSKLDINKNLKNQFNLLRICDNENYPAYFKYKSKNYILKIFKKKN